MIFITLGTQKFPFLRLLAKVEELILERKIQEDVFAQTGFTEYSTAHFKCEKFISMIDFDREIEKADLVVTHSGEGSIITSLRKGKRTVVVPRLEKFGEHVDNHQIEIAKNYGKANLLEICYDIEKLGEHIEAARTKEFAKLDGSKNKMVDIIEQWLEKEFK